jgi:hypothetical protein
MMLPDLSHLTERQKHALHMAAMAQMASFQLMVLLPFLAQDSGTAFTNSTLLGAVVGAYYLTTHNA